MPQVVWLGQSGCLLPMFIIFNLFFGRLFIHSTAIWLGIEGLLILIFILQMHFFLRKIGSQINRPQGRSEIIDVEGKVVEERDKLK
ncbi:hypothetical protein EPN54_04700 [bacterium]|nr:MAG: hypothetical protein EPN54_04700 [bacterium]